MSDPIKCDGDVFKDGSAVCVLNARSKAAEAWVQAVAQESGQRVDWHYSGGRANVLFIGDHAKVVAAVHKLAPSLDGTVLRIFEQDGAYGLHRLGDPVEPGVICVDQ